MLFVAKIKKNSHVDRLWRNRRQIAGQLCGVRFVLKDGEYIAEDFDTTSLDSLNISPFAVVEMTSVVSAPVSFVPDEAITEEQKVNAPTEKEVDTLETPKELTSEHDAHPVKRRYTRHVPYR